MGFVHDFAQMRDRTASEQPLDAADQYFVAVILHARLSPAGEGRLFHEISGSLKTENPGTTNGQS